MKVRKRANGLDICCFGTREYMRYWSDGINSIDARNKEEEELTKPSE